MLLKIKHSNVYKKLFFAVVTGMAMLIGCKKEGGGEMRPEDKNDVGFTRYEGHFLDDLWKINPDWATGVGFHNYDSLLILPAEQRKKMISFCKLQLDSLSRYPENELSENNRMDYYLIQNYLEGAQWNLQQLKAYDWDPTYYNNISTFAAILNEHYAPLPKRLKSFHEKLENLPAYYKEAQKQISNPVPELTDLAIDQFTGGAGIIEKDYVDSLKKSGLPEAQQKLMADRAKLSGDAIKAFVAWLKTVKSDKGRSFRLGKNLYEDKFKYDIQSASTAQQIFNAATERKKYLHRQMVKLAKELWPKYMDGKTMPSDSLEMVASVIGVLSDKHATQDGFQSAIEKQIPKLSAFVTAKGLLTLDPSKPLVVRKEPAYMAGVAGASISSPGPYDKGGNTYYNVGSLAGWDKDKAESFLREYNDYTLQILNIHEAIPGHYTQLVYSNNSPSLIKSILGNGAMVEGWAVYSEEMMLDAGYGDNAPEMRLMWYKWNLRSVCNTILDYSVHANNMSKEQAIKLLTKEAFQQQAEAEGKWTRVTVSSVQLTSYYTGYKEISELRDAYKKKMADKYRLKDFNEKFLSYGSAPVKYIKEAMLSNDKKEIKGGEGPKDGPPVSEPAEGGKKEDN